MLSKLLKKKNKADCQSLKEYSSMEEYNYWIEHPILKKYAPKFMAIFILSLVGLLIYNSIVYF